MKEYQSLSHTRWDCKYHVVFIPKRRKKLIFGKLRKHIGEVLHDPGKSEGKRDCGRPLYAESHSPVYKYSTQVLGVACSRFYQR